ncbi:MAG: AIR synthase-related protein [Candidatus Oleimicrobiaceae bacterium]
MTALSGPGLVERSRNLTGEPGNSVVRDAMVACQAGEVHAMHDPHRKGLTTGLQELAQAAGLGIDINQGEPHSHPPLMQNSLRTIPPRPLEYHCFRRPAYRLPK